MVSDIKNRITAFIGSEGKKVKIIIVIGIVGVMLIALSGIGSGGENNSNEIVNDISYEAYIRELEEKLKTIISSISGVGECEIMITLENTYESVYAINSEIKNNESSVNQKDEYVFCDDKSGEQPVLIKEYMPKVMGVSVVCTGGNDVRVKEKIIESVTALFNISANRVSVSKIKS